MTVCWLIVDLLSTQPTDSVGGNRVVSLPPPTVVTSTKLKCSRSENGNDVPDAISDVSPSFKIIRSHNPCFCTARRWVRDPWASNSLWDCGKFHQMSPSSCDKGPSNTSGNQSRDNCLVLFMIPLIGWIHATHARYNSYPLSPRQGEFDHFNVTIGRWSLGFSRKLLTTSISLWSLLTLVSQEMY